METIDLNNYGEYLLDYADGELGPALEAELLKFLEAHPALRQELALLAAARLRPDEKVVFPDKSSLYREARGSKVIRSGWWIAAAAAVAALVMVFYRPSRQTAVSDRRHPTVAATAPVTRRSPVVAPSASRPAATSADTALARLLPAVAPAPGEKTAAVRRPAAGKETAAAVAERQPVADRLPETAGPEPALITLHPMQRPALPEGEQLPVAPASVPDMPVSAAVAARGKEDARLFDHARSFTDSAKMTAARTEVALAGAKERLDDRITDKITGLQDRISHPFRGMEGKKIRIGHLQIAMNN